MSEAERLVALVEALREEVRVLRLANATLPDLVAEVERLRAEVARLSEGECRGS